MRKKTIFIIIALISINILVVFRYNLFAVNSGQDHSKIIITAKLIEYQSLCELPDYIEYCPKSIEFEKGEFKSIYCKSIEEKYGHPNAISIIFENKDSLERKVTIPDLSNILLEEGNGTVSPAIAVKQPRFNTMGPGCIYLFSNVATASIIYPLEPGKMLNILVLFSSAKKGEKIMMKNYMPLKVI
jgi:hypothetical protein